MMQHSSHLLMIKPVNFNYNIETAVNNRFQVQAGSMHLQQTALLEFENFVFLLRSKGIDVTVIEDTETPYTPDSIFPNNWISFHQHGIICLYPMFAENRRQERKRHVLEVIKKKFEVTEIIDMTVYELQGTFLEGTGSMVLDRDHFIAYACLSARTDKNVFQIFCEKFQYEPVYFTALDITYQPIYHTNVMMCVADTYAVICLESIQDAAEKQLLIDKLTKTGKQIIAISIDQMNHFAGNMLQVHTVAGKKMLVMSSQAYHSLTKNQLTQIALHNEIIHADITTIETNGGGSARCMLAEVFLSVRSSK